MNQVLFVKANCRSLEQSASVKLYHAFLDTYRKANPSDRVIEVDLYREKLPYYNDVMLDGMAKRRKGAALSPAEREAVGGIMRLLDPFVAADKIVFAFPMWNLTVPAVLHTYIDYVSQPGIAYRYTPEGPVGMLGNKKVALLNARGGVYSRGPAAEQEMAVNWMRHNLELLGIQDIVTVIVEGHDQYPEHRERMIDQGIAAAMKTAAAF
ncbi:MAG: FMN-dependent NADH-azoreductase [Paenibacillus dendritiformis]|uniref:FMN-dependent NADH-azoreductase n=1 Tax=Paenibacillus dendritiformis TaxID=130049 RepID=UPI00143CF0F6|nr:FMN-dependent NADH-azoreductase [Paenibacillus dendritiformis]MDU5144429.1 FMN-dependent NADH-azoreductase [Paenibacillus dendritiformis]NKI22268.1 FMN-dependent NADH-azoreductase [Paenibacillus dendritiformis]NRF99160.1 FMN-dependent NADH-azoreductase [Paenibacillus dendritiformis]GIO72846.1 FMN-dependent NADH-azoreductase 3 [Paenibacillus dendritiformis]